MPDPVTLPVMPGLRMPLELMEAGGQARGAEAARKTARDFESVLLHKLMGEMQRTVDESGLLSSGISDQVKSIFWFYLAQDVAEKGGMGLWQEIYRNALNGQPEAPAPPAVELDR